jgi:hypothetical protein
MVANTATDAMLRAAETLTHVLPAAFYVFRVQFPAMEVDTRVY